MSLESSRTTAAAAVTSCGLASAPRGTAAAQAARRVVLGIISAEVLYVGVGVVGGVVVEATVTL